MTFVQARTFLLLCALLWSGASWGALTSNFIGGVSSTDLTDPVKPIIYAGFAGTCSPDASSQETCNSCDGTGPLPCNRTNAYPALRLRLQLTSTNTALTPAGVTLTLGRDNFSPSALTVVNGVISITTTWNDICTFLDKTNCDGVNHDLIVSAGTTGASESFTYKLITRYVDPSDTTMQTYVDCGDGTPASANYGFCHFSAYPGDEKLYADELSAVDGYPASPLSSVNYSGVLFFYEQAADPNNLAGTVASITNASPVAEMTATTTANPPISDNRISGLENGATYCMLMANRDLTGIISYFTPGNRPTSELCATPDQVVGLLDDKSCFIATAAFESDMAPQVQSFRNFRDKYLLPYSAGRELVKFYYDISPRYAEMISQSELSKSLVRGILWPLLLFVELSIALGFWTALFMMVVLGAVARELYRHFITSRRVRGAS